jgi:hypothetical protein
MSGPDLVRTLREIRTGFLLHREPGFELPADFYLNMLDQQVIEAREHLAAGRPEKALAEVADCFSVGWQAIADAGVDPEAFILHRLRTRVLPRVGELHQRDVVAGRNGYKPATAAQSGTDWAVLE